MKKNTTIPAKPAASAQSVVCLASVLPRGDGSFILRPDPAALNGITWISTTKARAILGGMATTTFYRVLESCGDIIPQRRKSPHRIEVTLQGINEFQRKIADDPEFWYSRPFPARKGRK